METDTRDLYKHKKHLIKTFNREGRHLHIPNTTGKLVVVGDLHGDGRTLDLILNKFLFESSEFILLFLGDYVDKEPSSWNNQPSAVVDRLLQLKLQYPERAYIAMGNHDIAPSYVQYHSTFWGGLNDEQYEFYSDVLSSLPLVTSSHNGVAMCHGTLPLSTDFTTFSLHDRKWIDTIWSDYLEHKSEISSAVRPYQLEEDFNRSMKAFGASLLIHGHNPFQKLVLMNGRNISIQSNRHYSQTCGMHIAIVDLEKAEIRCSGDIEIVDISEMVKATCKPGKTVGRKRVDLGEVAS